MFAYVRFVEDKDCQIVSSASIVGFWPCSEEDFDAVRVYEVDIHGVRQQINVVAMAESETQLEEVVKRMQIPGILDGSPTAEEVGSQEDDEDSDEVQQTHREGKRKRHEEAAERGVGEKARKSRGDERLQPLYPVGMETAGGGGGGDDGGADADGGDAGGAVPRRLYREAVQSCQSAKASLQKSMAEIELLKKENEELRRMNKNLQEALVRKIFTAPGIDATRAYGNQAADASGSTGNGSDETPAQPVNNGQLCEETMKPCNTELMKQNLQQQTGATVMQGSSNPMMQNDMQFLMGMNNAMQILMAMNNGMPFQQSTQAAFTDMSKKPICRHFAQKGGCRYGNTCAFYHPGMNGPPLP